MRRERQWGALLWPALALALAACLPAAGPEEASSAPPAPARATLPPASVLSSGEPAGEMAIHPQGLVTYQAYLDVIGGRPGPADSATVEATVVSLHHEEVCPYRDQEQCPIEPYPRDWAMVRIDAMREHVPYGSAGPPAEGAQPGSESPGEETSPQYRGAESAPAQKAVPPLREGQEVQALFLLTARPAQARYEPAAVSGGLEAAQGTGPGTGETQEQPLGPAQRAFPPLTTRGGRYVFVTRIGDYAAPVEILLPGLEAGDRFRARVRYDGILYVKEYELLP